MNEKQIDLLSDIIAKTGMIALAGFAVKGVLIDDYYMVGKGIAAYLISLQYINFAICY